MKNFGTTELVKTNGSWHEGLLWGQTGGGRGIRSLHKSLRNLAKSPIKQSTIPPLVPPPCSARFRVAERVTEEWGVTQEEGARAASFIEDRHANARFAHPATRGSFLPR